MAEDTNTPADKYHFIAIDEKSILLDALKKAGYKSQRSIAETLREEGWRRWDNAGTTHHYKTFTRITSGRDAIDEDTAERLLKLCHNDPQLGFLREVVVLSGGALLHPKKQWEEPLQNYFCCIRNVYYSQEPEGRLKILGDLEKLVQGLKE